MTPFRIKVRRDRPAYWPHRPDVTVHVQGDPPPKKTRPRPRVPRVFVPKAHPIPVIRRLPAIRTEA